MSNFLLIAVCMLAGFLLKKTGVLTRDASKGINTWIIYIALPAVSFKYLPQIHWTKELIVPAVVPVAVWIGALAWVWLYVKLSKNPVDAATRGGMKIVSGLCNTSFVGFPLIMAWYGESYLGIAVIPDQITFILLSTVGLTAAIKGSSGGKFSPKLLAKRIVKFPPVWGCALALTVPHIADLSALDPLFDKLAGTVGPLALFSIGLQLQFEGWKEELKPVLYMLGYKLLLAPLLVFTVLFCSGFRGPVAQISVFEMAMPTLLTAGIIADEFDLNAKLVNLTIGLSILAGFITTGVWHFILQWLA